MGLDQYEVRRWDGWHRHITHDFLGQQDNLTVEQQESGQPVPFDQPELLVQPVAHLAGYGAVTLLCGLQREAAQVAAWGVAFGQGIAQIRIEIEGALLRNPDGVVHSLGVSAEDFPHPLRGFHAEMMVGTDEWQGLLDGGVALGCN